MGHLANVLVDMSPVAMILLKASILLALGWILHVALKVGHANAQWRRVLWRGLMVGLLLIPVAQLMGEWKVIVARPTPLSTETKIITPTEKLRTSVLPVPSATETPSTFHAVSAPSRPNGSSEKLHFYLSVWAGKHMLQLFLAGWFIGVVILLVRHWVLVARIYRIRARARPARADFQGLLNRVAREMGNRRPVLLQFASDVKSPFLIGLRRPAIVLPECMNSSMYVDDLPCILAHEVAHIRAHDLWWMAMGRLVSTLLWFLPLVWRLCEAHSIACEEICDRVAAKSVGDAKKYTTTLARVALAVTGAVPSVGGISMARSSQIIIRLRHLETSAQSDPLPRWRIFLCAMLGFVAFAAGAGVRLAYAEGTVAFTAPQVKSKVETEIMEPRNRILRVGFPLPLSESFVFDNPSDLLQGKLKLRIIHAHAPEHAATTDEYIIFEKGKLAEGWKITEGGTRSIYENGSSEPPRRIIVSGVQSQFLSTERHLTAPNDTLELELVAVKDLTGKTSLETGYLPAGTYKAKGKYSVLTDEFDAASYLAQYVKAGEEPSARVLKGLEKTREANEWRAQLTAWDARWPLKVMAKGGWLRSSEELVLAEESVRQATSTVQESQRAKLVQERKWRQEFIVADQGPEAACRVNLFEIMHALITYQQPHQNLFPSSLANLFPNYIQYSDALLCPSTRESLALGNGMSCSYRYLGPVLPLDAFPELFIIYDRPMNHVEGRNVGLYGGQIKFYKESEFQQILATQYERLKPIIARADFPGDRGRAKAFFEDKDFAEVPPIMSNTH